MKVPAEQLKSILGITDVNYVRGSARVGGSGFFARTKAI